MFERKIVVPVAVVFVVVRGERIFFFFLIEMYVFFK